MLMTISHLTGAHHGDPLPAGAGAGGHTPEIPSLIIMILVIRRILLGIRLAKYIKIDINIKFCILVFMKDVRFVGSSLDDLKHFPAGARREAGFELSNVQAGLPPSNWKPSCLIRRGHLRVACFSKKDTENTQGGYRVG